MNPLVEAAEALLKFANQGAVELLVWSWQALVLLAGVWVGLKLLRVQTPALRQHIWLIALLAVFTLPLWPLLLPKLPLPERQRWHSPALNYAAELPRLVIAPTAETALPVRQAATGTAASKSYALKKTLAVVFCLWLAGALWVFVRNVRSYARLHKARQQARPVTPAELGLTLRLPQFVSLGLSAAVRSPVLLGFWHPLILLPHDLAEWTTVEERNAMIAHELAHLARRDHFTNLFPLALNIIFFFHPMVRYACRQFCLEREMACDDRVIHYGADAATYAESLVKAAEHSIQGRLGGLPAHSLHQPAFFTSKQALERRIEMILTTNRVRVLTRQWRYLILPATLIALLAWLLVPVRPITAQQVQRQYNATLTAVKGSSLKELLVSYMTGPAAYDDLVNTVLESPDAQLREQTLRQLVESDWEWATTALAEIYDRTDEPTLRSKLIGQLGERKAFAKLLELAVKEPGAALRQQAVQRLLEIEGDGSEGALIDLYSIVRDQPTRESIIRTFGQRGELGGLALVRDVESDQGLLRLNWQQFEWLAVHSESADTRRAAQEWMAMKRGQSTGKDSPSWGPPPPPPPPPPPMPRELLNDSAEIASLLRLFPRDDGTIILALLRAVADAQIRNDTAFLERAFTDDYEAIGPNGEVLNKAETIAEAKRLDRHIKKFEIDNYRQRDDGSSAVASFLGTVYYEENGKENTVQFRYTVNLIKRQGGWQIAGSHQSLVR
jgi:beta-lactamase regulating signal transducer with metallopeptidase domain